ncbi:hypothetical protein [Roseivirga sp. UBA838]|uniref:hypothetical protein n=1 Tax=Roseivirga sp. UBA838 TaxID=1947393 RepID=UPI002579455D|nr:hypothetical protein [Roseivirga sp. UBA838]|tara:strand:- start:17924 stop:18430 length:507 start_codon:yes stop_codon:yes gene_type:complete
MMTKIRLAVLLIFSISLAMSCNSGGDKVKYVLAETVEIEYYDTLKKDEWISIDGVTFKHLDTYEALKEDSIPENEFYTVDILPTTLQQIYIPGAESHEFLSTYGDAQVVFELFKHLAVKSDEQGNQIYKFAGHSLDMSRGKMTLMRHDGKKIKVSTSEGYGAAVRKVE